MDMKFKTFFVLLGLILTCGILPYSIAFADNKYIVPGDVRKGWQVFIEKGCVQCHAMGEKSRSAIAPDLLKSSSTHLSASGLAAVMWNHAPAMWEKMSAKWFTFKKFNQTETADLFAFIYFIRYLDTSGNPDKGRTILNTKGCADCHSIGGKGGKIGPDLAMWKDYTNPILWVQMMWNHATKMKIAMEKETLTWPKLERNDIIDIIAYISTIGKPARIKEVILVSGDPMEGKRIFSARGCGRCHEPEETGKQIGPNLVSGIDTFPPTVGQLASLMWNHFPDMLNIMKQENIKLPDLSAKDMADITAYLFSLHYFDLPGNPVAGGKIFQTKQCVVCHDKSPQTKTSKYGPNLAAMRGRTSPIYIATALWNHGPNMVSSMKDRNIKWQKISDKELNDLIAYLNLNN